LARISPEGLELRDKVVNVARVAKVVKGGKRFSFAALVVVGDEKGHVGVGTGKSKEVQEAIQKGVTNAKKNLVKVTLKEGTLPHEVIGHFGSARVMMKPACPGTGVIAGGGVRIVLELAGAKNVLTKSLGSKNSYNVVYATFEGLAQLRTERLNVSLEAGKGLEIKSGV
jgi:small subunit ribosomal protein S5